MISKEPLKTAFLIVSNYKYPSEKVTKTDENGNNYSEIVEGKTIYNKQIQLPGDYQIEEEFVFNNKEFEPQPVNFENSKLSFEKLEPAEFKIYKLTR